MWKLVLLLMLSLMYVRISEAQPFCRGPYCGPVDPRVAPVDPRGYRRGPMGDWLDRCFDCQGPMYPRQGPPHPYYQGWRGNNYPFHGYPPPWR